MKTIVFAYSEFGCIGIEALAAAGYDVQAVFTYPDDPRDAGFYRSVAQTCIEYDIPAYIYEDTHFTLIQNIAPDYIFSFYYRSLISDQVLALARKGAYNIHGSLLPDYRGRAPVNWVLVNGETRTGVTLHHMVSRADAGDIVAQVPVDIAYEDTAYSLQRKLLVAAEALFKTQLPLIAQGKAARITQDISKGRYFGRRGPEDVKIDWSKPAEAVRNLIRAVTVPYPGAFTEVNGRKFMIWSADIDKKTSEKLGIIASISPLIIACGQGAIVVKCAQFDDGLPLSGKQLALEYSLKIGQKFTP